MFKLDNFGVILFVSFSYKKLLQKISLGNDESVIEITWLHYEDRWLACCLFHENLKNRCKNRFFRKKFKKFVYYNEELVTNSNAIISKTTTIHRLS